MPIKIGTGDIKKIYLGSTEIKKIYRGSELVYSSAFDPLSLSPVLWLDGADESTVTKDGSNRVSVWSDKSGNGNDATQSNINYQSYYDLSNKSIFFDDRSGYQYYNFGNIELSEYTVYVVKKNTPLTKSLHINYILFGRGGNNTGNWGLSTGSNWDYVAPNKGAFVYNQLAPSHNALTLYRTDKRIYKFSNEQVSDSFETITYIRDYPNYAIKFLGRNYITNSTINLTNGGYIYEILIFNRSLTASEDLAVNNYLNNKWFEIPELPTTSVSPSFWLDGKDLNTITKDASNYVTGWADKSGNGNHFLNPETDNKYKPTYLGDGITFLNEAYLATTATTNLEI